MFHRGFTAPPQLPAIHARCFFWGSDGDGDNSDEGKGGKKKPEQKSTKSKDNASENGDSDSGKSADGGSNSSDNAGGDDNGNDDILHLEPDKVGNANANTSINPLSLGSTSSALASPTTVPALNKVLALPATGRPLFPGLATHLFIRHQPTIDGLKKLVEAGQPFVGVFLKKEQTNEEYIR